MHCIFPEHLYVKRLLCASIYSLASPLTDTSVTESWSEVPISPQIHKNVWFKVSYNVNYLEHPNSTQWQNHFRSLSRVADSRTSSCENEPLYTMKTLRKQRSETQSLWTDNCSYFFPWHLTGSLAWGYSNKQVEMGVTVSTAKKCRKCGW